MNPAVTQLFRLFPPGGPGLSCEADGVALGDVSVGKNRSSAWRALVISHPIGLRTCPAFAIADVFWTAERTWSSR